MYQKGNQKVTKEQPEGTKGVPRRYQNDNKKVPKV
jgi:hypothetical protein